MDGLLRDVRYALRGMRRAPGFTVVVLLTTALGVGANTTIFAVVYAALLRPLPYPAADRVVMAADQSPANILDWHQRTRSFDAMAALCIARFDVTGFDAPIRVDGAIVTGGFFSVLGVRPALGRALEPSDDGRAERVVVVANEFWRQRLGASPAAVGSTVLLNGEAHTIVGVMPPGFTFPERTLAWVAPRFAMPPHPLQPDTDPVQLRQSHYLGMYGRLKAGVTHAAAQAEQRTIFEDLHRQHPTDVAADEVDVPLVSLRDWLVGDVRPALLVLLGAVALVLLIGCANIANLLLARAATRRQEIVVRTALGASRARITRQVITESVVLAAAGGASGALSASWALPVLLAVGPEDVQVLRPEVGIPVVAFALVLSIVSGVLFGCAPALHAFRSSITLRSSARSTDSPAGRRLRRLLVVGEMALTVALLAGAGLMIRSFVQLRSVSPGFRPAGLESARIDLPIDRYREAERQAAFFDRLLEDLGAAPGIESAAAAARLPFAGGNSTRSIGLDVPGATTDAWGGIRVISAGYFDVMGIPLRRGRPFTNDDRAGTLPVAIVNETMARRYWPGSDPLGHRFRILGKGPWLEIVGVVADVKHGSLRDSNNPEFYQPYPQAPWNFMHVIVRSRIGHAALVHQLAAALRRIDPALPSAPVQSLDGLLARSVSFDRFEMIGLGIFAAVALTLSIVGLYGVMSFAVSQRTREIGVRVALGASPAGILRLVAGEGLALIAAGLATGLALAMGTAIALRSWLFGVSTWDPWTFATVIVVLATVGLAASLLPARRAMKTDPIVALRTD